eukprot:CAMPEP_0113535780 /NCGR_PEP_ID=MMETSP0015_2-20120614/5900_1 /TAXON_ID=2838 /ORGANISM="Odontella" /LENGTH=314 /DNA_ID=CAMNT_0000435081 /DNA_START=154 /DNA_END=1094 /DNA_ORIENTATION=+ /assembly_acc=CAM_ASM_000160
MSASDDCAKFNERSSGWYQKCAEAGAIGGIGAIPGTLAAHPADVVKVRQQVSSEPLLRAVSQVYQGRKGRSEYGRLGARGSTPAAAASLRNFFSGSVPAVQQKVMTRTPMFLVSSVSVSLFESKLGFEATSAAFVGSAISGYLTGFLASPWEWQKVLVSQNITSPARQKGMHGLVSEAIRAHGLSRGSIALGRRFHAAGVRNAIFDSTFFGCKHILEDRLSKKYPGHPYLDSGCAYGAAALVAVMVDYAVDVTAKRLYANGPERNVPQVGVLRSTVSNIISQGSTLFRGLGFKCVEFSLSYLITGLMAANVASG